MSYRAPYRTAAALALLAASPAVAQTTGAPTPLLPPAPAPQATPVPAPAVPPVPATVPLPDITPAQATELAGQTLAWRFAGPAEGNAGDVALL